MLVLCPRLHPKYTCNPYARDSFKERYTRMTIKVSFTLGKIGNSLQILWQGEINYRQSIKIGVLQLNHVYEEYLMTCRIRWKKGDSCLVYFCLCILQIFYYKHFVPLTGKKCICVNNLWLDKRVEFILLLKMHRHCV